MELNSISPNLRKPKSYMRMIPAQNKNSLIDKILTQEHINTICVNANCPNRAICFSCGTASILALGNICTRNCRFCAVKKGTPPLAPDETEPKRIARAVKKLGLESVVITTPTRDDLPDGGAKHLELCVSEIKKECDNCKIELLIPDNLPLDIILNCGVDCISHNIEMPKNLYPKLRMNADFDRSINILKYIKGFDCTPKDSGIILKGSSVTLVKTGFMVGLGESESDIFDLIGTLAEIPVSILTIGQYFQPTKASFPVQKYYEESDFGRFAKTARNAGIKKVLSGVFVRSSFENNI